MKLCLVRKQSNTNQARSERLGIKMRREYSRCKREKRGKRIEKQTQTDKRKKNRHRQSSSLHRAFRTVI